MKSLRMKLLLSFTLLLLLLAALGVLTYINVQNTNKEVEEMISKDLRMTLASEAFTQNIAERISAVRAYILFDSGVHSLDYSRLTDRVPQLEEELRAAIQTETDRELIDGLLAQNDQWTALIEEEILTAFAAGNEERAKNLLQSEAESQSSSLIYQFRILSQEKEAGMQALGDSIIETGKNVEQLILMIVSSSLVIGVVTALFSANRIVKPIIRVAERLDTIAQGDLSGESLTTKSKDEIGRLVASTNVMAQNLRNLVTNMNESSEHIAASAQELTASSNQTSHATEQIAASAQEMAAGAETQLNSVDETAATINQMSAGIQEIATNSETVSALAKDASKASIDGVNTVNEVVEQMESIDKTVKSTADVIQTLGERSNEIGNIVTIITNISDQTSLLALNAAIEAARAGEAGQGFAVVADEVRKLAEESAQSASQITKLIRTIQEETAIAIESMEDGTKKVASGLLKTNNVSNVFNTIEKAVADVEIKVQEVSVAAEQMAAGSNQMIQSIEIVKQSAEDNARASQDNSAASEEQLAMMEEIESSAQALTNLADQMTEVIQRFKL